MMTLDMDTRSRRAIAANQFKPKHIRLLMIAEAPPAAPDRYFYFENVPTQDSLFRCVTKGLFSVQPSRDKLPLLKRLQDNGVFLIDLKLDPIDGSNLRAYVPDLLKRCRELNPEKIVLIKATVYDAAYQALKSAGLPVVNARIPFPGSGQQRNFEITFSQALQEIDWPQ